MRFQRLLTPLAIVALLGLAWWSYAPGLAGGFLFDDAVNLDALGNFGRIHDLEGFARYITSGIADRTGRPVALLTFLLDANNWPADPYPFKRTNLVLHLLNGVLLGMALVLIGRAIGVDRRRARAAAVLGAALWALHPLFVSTTLYIVQRQAMLPATFVFAALSAWLLARERLLTGATRGPLLAAGAAVFVGTALAVLSKANGMLLPLLLLAVDACLPRATNEPTALRRARWICLRLPSIAIALAVLAQVPASMRSAALDRTWTLGQRLLTEPRALLDYAELLWLPRAFTPGLFNDDFTASTGLLQPWTTLPALLIVSAAFVLALVFRRRAPAAAMAVLFFLAGHLIESGPVALELYFEHRNYLPAALMFWPLALWLTRDAPPLALRRGLALALPLGLALLTRMNASLWGDPDAQALVWAQKNPDSPRAQAYAAQTELALHRIDAAERRLRTILAAHPHETQLAINLVGTRCAAGSVDAADLAMLGRVMRTDPDPTRLGISWLQTAVATAYESRCAGFGPEQLRALAADFAANPRTAQVAGRRRDLAQLEAMLALREHDGAAARAAFVRAFDIDRRAELVLVQSAMLASAHEPQLALEHLRLAVATEAKPWYAWRSMSDVHDWVLWRQGFWDRQIDELRAKIAADLEPAR